MLRMQADITPEVIREMMAPRDVGADLPEGTLATRPPPAEVVQARLVLAVGRGMRMRATRLNVAMWIGEAGRVGPARDGMAGGRDGARHAEPRNDPIRGCAGRQGQQGRAGTGLRGWWS